MSTTPLTIPDVDPLAASKVEACHLVELLVQLAARLTIATTTWRDCKGTADGSAELLRWLDDEADELSTLSRRLDHALPWRIEGDSKC